MNDEAERFLCCALRHQFASKPLRLYAYQRRSIFLSRGCWRQALRSVCWHNKRSSGLYTVNSHPAVLCLLCKTHALAETLDVRNSKNDQLLKAVKPVNIYPIETILSQERILCWCEDQQQLCFSLVTWISNVLAVSQCCCQAAAQKDSRLKCICSGRSDDSPI